MVAVVGFDFVLDDDEGVDNPEDSCDDDTTVQPDAIMGRKKINNDDTKYIIGKEDE